MGQKVFIPMTDEILFDRPELISSPLRPYNRDLPCLHWLDIELNPAESTGDLMKRESFGAQRAKRKPIIDVAYPHFAAA